MSFFLKKIIKILIFLRQFMPFKRFSLKTIKKNYFYLSNLCLLRSLLLKIKFFFKDFLLSKQFMPFLRLFSLRISFFLFKIEKKI